MKYGLIILALSSVLWADTQTISVSGTGIAAPPVTGLSFSNPSWTFGSVPVGQNVPSGTITITNVGSGSITLTSQVFTGTNAGDFPITANTCGTNTLAASASCNVTFNFAPSDVGTRSASLVWTSSDPFSPQSTAVSGTGIAANSFLNFSNASWDFSSLLVGTTSPVATVTATNGGNVPLTFFGTSITGLNPGDFAISANTCIGTLAAGASCTFSFSFTPLATGARSANVEFSDDASPTPGPQDVPIIGTGTAPISNATVSFSFASWTFGSHRIGTTSGTGHTTITNTGNTALTFSSISFTGTNASDFAITANTCGSTLAAGANCTVTFNTTPSGVGLRTSFLTFADTATGSPQLVTVSGPGTAPAPSIQFSGHIRSAGKMSAH